MEIRWQDIGERLVRANSAAQMRTQTQRSQGSERVKKEWTRDYVKTTM